MDFLNPLKSIWFYGGVALGVSEWAAVWIPSYAKNILLNLPGLFLMAAVFSFLGLHAISRWASPRLQEYAEADKRNFGPFIASAISGSGHAITGVGIIALSHYLHTLVAGSSLKLFLTCLCVAPSFYWHAWGIQKLIQHKHDE